MADDKVIELVVESHHDNIFQITVYRNVPGTWQQYDINGTPHKQALLRYGTTHSRNPTGGRTPTSLSGETLRADLVAVWLAGAKAEAEAAKRRARIDRTMVNILWTKISRLRGKLD